MRIVLTEDISLRKGWVRGCSYDWERPTITAISRNLGNEKWFELAEEVERRTNGAAMRGRRKAQE